MKKKEEQQRFLTKKPNEKVGKTTKALKGRSRRVKDDVLPESAIPKELKDLLKKRATRKNKK